MVYKTARQKILIGLFVILIFITFFSGTGQPFNPDGKYVEGIPVLWKFWFLPTIFVGLIYLVGKLPAFGSL